LPNGKICLWDLTTAKEQRQFVGYAPLAVSPNGKWLAANTLQGVSQIELESGKQIREFKNGGAPEAQAISADGKSLAFVNGWGSCWVVDTQTHEVSFHLPGPEKQASALYAVAFPPGAKLLASGGIDGKIHLHDVTTKSLVFQFPGHRELGAPEAWGNEGRRLGEIRSLAFSPDGRTLATCGEHDAVILWEVLTGKQRQALRGHGTNVWCVAFSPDGRRLASAGADGTVLLWELLSPMK
jgi:WD40 repeat protein